jgi:rhodanese-related sulfurtransferase
MEKEITVIEARDMIKNRTDLQLIDLRTPSEFRKGSVQGFVNIPLNELSLKIPILEGKKTTLLLCKDSTKSFQGQTLLEVTGFKAHVIRGGMQDWVKIIDSSIQL